MILEMIKSIRIKPVIRELLLVLVALFLAMATVVFIAKTEQVSYYDLTSDITVVFDAPVYIGLLTQLGIFLWAASAAISYFCFSVLKKPLKGFFFFAFMISILLGLDDAFLFHEEVFNTIGIPQKVVLLSYALIVGVFLFKYKSMILKSDFLLLLFAFMCFGSSVFIDLFMMNADPMVSVLTEDAAKFAGILFWLAYFFRVGRLAIFSKTY